MSFLDLNGKSYKSPNGSSNICIVFSSRSMLSFDGIE